MIKKIGDNIVSPLGFTTEENWRNLLAGHSGLQHYEQGFSLPEPFCASIINTARLEERFLALPNPQGTPYTKMEKCALLSATDALTRAGLDPAREDVLFILSTTKGNVELLRDLQGYEKERPYLWRSAQLIAQYFGNPNEPVVVSNACISGCAAQVVAQRQLEQGRYRYAVVIGADVLSQFVISGFQSFKALSPDPCRPFDATRAGLNLGEGAGYIVMQRCEDAVRDPYCLLTGYANANDAYHQTGCSPEGNGAFKSMSEAMAVAGLQPSDIDYINVHGTATPNNDLSEATAIRRIFGDSAPFSSVKAFIGHTLGASEGIEAVYSALSVKNGYIYPNLNFNSVDPNIGLSPETEFAEGRNIRNVLSNAFGFGGNDTTLLFSKFEE